MRLIVISLIAMLTLAGCTQKSDTQNSSKINSNDAELAAAADKIVAGFSKDLKGALMNAINDEGITGAVTVCAEAAPRIAAEHSDKSIRIYRVSDRNRNLTNYTTEHQQTIMAKFADSLTNLTSYQEWLNGDSSKTFCYYKPIRTGVFCLQCHGTADKISPEIVDVLNETYPEDKARGYQANELRGMFVVEIDWPEADDYLKSLATENQ